MSDGPGKCITEFHIVIINIPNTLCCSVVNEIHTLKVGKRAHHFNHAINVYIRTYVCTYLAMGIAIEVIFLLMYLAVSTY